MALKKAQWEILELLVEMRAKLAQSPVTYVVEPVYDKPVQGATSTNAE